MVNFSFTCILIFRFVIFFKEFSDSFWAPSDRVGFPLGICTSWISSEKSSSVRVGVKTDNKGWEAERTATIWLSVALLQVGLIEK